MSRLLRRQRIQPALPVLPLLAVPTLFLVAAPPAFARTWKSSDGAYSVDAEFVDFKDGTVSLRKADGAVIRVPVSRLSAEDQAYVAEQVAAVDASPLTRQTYSQLARSASSLRTAAEGLRM